MKTRLLFFILSVVPAMLHAAGGSEARSGGFWGHSLVPTSALVQGDLGYTGLPSGFIQIPAGGHPGSSSKGRPDFDELNIRRDNFYDLYGQVYWDKFGVYGRYRYLRPSATSTSIGMITHNVPVAPGTGVRMNTKFDTYYFGLKYDVFSPGLKFSPRIEYAMMDFRYRFRLSTGVNSSRAFKGGTFRVGADFSHHLDDARYWKFSLAASIPNLNNLEIYDIDVTYNHLLYHDGVLRVEGYLGIGAMYLEFEDKQPMPNHIKVEAYPMFKAGLSVVLV